MALTVHLVRATGKLDDRFLAEVRGELQEQFSIDTAIQLEEGDPAYPASSSRSMRCKMALSMTSGHLANRSRCKGEEIGARSCSAFKFYVAVTAMQDRLAVTSPPFSGR